MSSVSLNSVVLLFGANYPVKCCHRVTTQREGLLPTFWLLQQSPSCIAFLRRWHSVLETRPIRELQVDLILVIWGLFGYRPVRQRWCVVNLDTSVGYVPAGLRSWASRSQGLAVHPKCLPGRTNTPFAKFSCEIQRPSRPATVSRLLDLWHSHQCHQEDQVWPWNELLVLLREAGAVPGACGARPASAGLRPWPAPCGDQHTAGHRYHTVTAVGTFLSVPENNLETFTRLLFLFFYIQPVRVFSAPTWSRSYFAQSDSQAEVSAGWGLLQTQRLTVFHILICRFS